MIILKNKTYNDLMLRLDKSESDLKKQIEKTDNVQSEFDIYKESIKENLNYLEDNLDKEQVENSKLVVELKEKTDFISSLNERVQKAEFEKEQMIYNLMTLNKNCDDYELKIKELESKLSRKGLGVKGKKKNNGAFPYDYNTEIHKKS